MKTCGNHWLSFSEHIYQQSFDDDSQISYLWQVRL